VKTAVNPSPQQAQLGRVNTDLAGITGRHVTVLLGGALNQPTPDHHVLNRIK
jgi:hypothetical protein